MVNRGKPSGNCLPCRKRKLHCDLATGACGQCKRAGLTCVGYRDPHAVIFRNETRKVQQRAKSISTPTTSISLSQQHLHKLQEYLAIRSSKSVPLAIDARARHEFFLHYVTRDAAAYNMLGNVYNESKDFDFLSISIDAVSLAFIASRYGNQPEISNLATEAYVKAIRALAKAVTDPGAALSDATVQSILLLDLYEKMMNRSALIKDTARTHLTGALVLLQLRGTGNASTYIGRRFVERLCVVTIISCAAAGARVPKQISELQAQLDPYIDMTDVHWILTKLSTAAVTLRVNIRTGYIYEPRSIVTQARSIDVSLASLEHTLSPRWKPTQIHVSKGTSRLVYGNSYDIYKSQTIVNIRNTIRTLRLQLHAMMGAHKRVVPTLLDPKSAGIIDNCCRDIVASIPSFIIPGARLTNAEPFSPVQMLECYTLLLPMFLVYRNSRNQELSTWTLSIINHMAENGGMKLAKTMLDIIRKDEPTAYWDIYTLLGGYAFAI